MEIPEKRFYDRKVGLGFVDGRLELDEELADLGEVVVALGEKIIEQLTLQVG